MGGTLLAIGLLLGRDGPEGDKEPAYEEAGRFRDAFRKRFGALSCPALIGLDLADPAQRARARAEGVLTRRCAVFLEWGAEWVGRLLERHRPGPAGRDPEGGRRAPGREATAVPRPPGRS